MPDSGDLLQLVAESIRRNEFRDFLFAFHVNFILLAVYLEIPLKAMLLTVLAFWLVMAPLVARALRRSQRASLPERPSRDAK